MVLTPGFDLEDSFAHADDGFVVGAYATSPAHSVWNAKAERSFFAGLETVGGVAAIELPWVGRIHPHDDEWLHRNFPSTWWAVVTDIPHTMNSLASMPGYGLASRDRLGRSHAIRDLARLRDDVQRFNDAQSRRVVRAVEIHTAPRGDAGEGTAFAESLREICAWDWDGAELVVEHCDAWNPSHPPQKGFLTLADEMAAIASAGVEVGISINWARSVIETRDPDTPVAHLTAASAEGLLRGFIASGVAPVDTDFGPAWIDAHLPFAQYPSSAYAEPSSLLTHERLYDALDVVGGDVWVGVKVSCARPDASVADRVNPIAESLATLAAHA